MGVPGGHAEGRGRVSHHQPVVRVDERRNAVRPAHRDDREDVIDMAVGQQHRGGLEPVLPEDRVYRVLDPTPGSMMMHSSPGAGATTKQFVSKA